MAIASTIRIAFASALTLGGFLISVGSAAERPLALNQAADREAAEPTPTAGEEAAALAFVKEHHGELANLLRVLKNKNPQQYRSAVRDLNRTRDRLEQVRRRSDARYEVELRSWQVKSRIQLLTARLHMADTPALRADLAAAMREQVELRRAALQLERERLSERLNKIDEQLERIDDPDALAERQLQVLLGKLHETKRDSRKKFRPPRETSRPKPNTGKAPPRKRG